MALLDQIPGDMVTVPVLLAFAMGNPIAESAVKEALKREKFQPYRDRVVPKSDSSDSHTFSGFRGKGLLEELVEKQERKKGCNYVPF